MPAAQLSKPSDVVRILLQAPPVSWMLRVRYTRTTFPATRKKSVARNTPVNATNMAALNPPLPRVATARPVWATAAKSPMRRMSRCATAVIEAKRDVDAPISASTSGRCGASVITAYMRPSSRIAGIAPMPAISAMAGVGAAAVSVTHT